MKMKVMLYLAIHCMFLSVLAGRAASTEDSGVVFIEQGGKRVEMDYVAGFTKNISSMLFYSGGNSKFVIMASGEQAQMRIQEKRPIFYVKEHPSEIGIVKFDTDTYNKKPVRYVLKKGDLWQTGGQAGSPGEANVDFNFKKDVDGLYKVTLKEPLDRGEYAIIIAKGLAGPLAGYGGGNKYMIYDFGVE